MLKNLAVKIQSINSAQDPAGSQFTNVGANKILAKTDAEFVDVIHTWSLGLHEEIGTIDFYPNDGINQPSCKNAFLDISNLIILHFYFGYI